MRVYTIKGGQKALVFKQYFLLELGSGTLSPHVPEFFIPIPDKFIPLTDKWTKY